MVRNRRSFLSLLLALAFALMTSPPARTEGEVILKHVGVPLAEIAKALSVGGAPLTVEPRLREVKAVVLVRNRPRQEVLSGLESIFGAKWTPLPEGGLELRRTDDVERWARDWRNSRAKAVEEARARIAALVRRNLDKVIEQSRRAPSLTEQAGSEAPDGVLNVSATRFLGTLPPRDLDLLARSFAQVSPLHRGGDDRLEGSAPLVYAFRDLSRSQQDLLRDYIRENDLKGLDDRLHEAKVGFRVSHLIRLDARLPNGKRFGDYLILGSSGGILNEGYLQEAILRRMSARSTPKNALLGAELQSMTKKDLYGGDEYHVYLFEPPVLHSGEDPAFPAAELRPPGLLFQQWVSLTHQQSGIDIISDFYSQPLRLDHRPLSSPMKAQMSQVLPAAAKAYQRVFRARNGLLLSRSTFWPDRDQEEVPGDQLSRWRQLKRETGRLPFEELTALSRLTEAQQNSIAAYDDGEVRFAKDFFVIRTRRELFATLRQLSPSQWRAIRSPAGLVIATIAAAAKRPLLEDLLKHAESRNEELPEGWEQSYLRLYSYTSGGDSLYAFVPPAKQPFWEAQGPFTPPGGLPQRPGVFVD